MKALTHDLEALRSKDKLYVAEGIPTIIDLANKIDFDASVDEEDKIQRCVFYLRRYAGEETYDFH